MPIRINRFRAEVNGKMGPGEGPVFGNRFERETNSPFDGFLKKVYDAIIRYKDLPC